MSKTQKNNTKLLDENTPICPKTGGKLVPHRDDPTTLVLDKYATRNPVWLHPGKSPGAPTKCTQEITQDICTLLQTGAHIDVVCEAVGIDRTSYYLWLRNAEQDAANGKYPGWSNAPDNSPYLAFSHNAKRAFHFAEVKLLSKLHNAEGDKTWMRLAWILERTRNDRYGQRQQVDVTHTVSGPDVPQQPPETHSQWLEQRDAERALLQAHAEDVTFSEVTVTEEDTGAS